MIFGWLTHPTYVILALLSIILLPSLIRPLPYKRRIRATGATLLGFYLLSASPVAIALGQKVLTQFVPVDRGEPADAIVILGRGSSMRRDRSDIAADLWRQGRAPFIFVSGIYDAPAMVDYLKSEGLPADAVGGEPCSRTTEENAQYTASILEPMGIRRIILITDPPHMLRSRLTFQSLGFEVIPHYSPLPRTLGARTASLLVFREYAGLAAYGVLGRFNPREILPPTEINAASLHVNRQMVKRKLKQAIATVIKPWRYS